MNAVGIDVSKGKSMIAVMLPFGKIVAKPFEIRHTPSELKKLADFLKSLDGETRVIMEYTGKYYQPIARYLSDSGLFISVVHAKLIHDYGNNTIRKVKTDKADSVKIANYGLSNWMLLKPYTPEDDTRLLLKTCNRQYNQYMKLKVALKNNLISILDQTFAGCNTLFTSPARPDGHEKWIDFTARFWHCDCVRKHSPSHFAELYNNWCSKAGYYKNTQKADEIYDLAKSQIPTLPCDDFTKQIVKLAVEQLNSVSSTLSSIQQKMQHLASTLPEYPVVLAMHGVGETLGPQLMAEIGDVRRFPRKQSLIAFAGVDAPPFQSGSFEAKDRNISKRGSSSLRKTLFQVMSCLLQNSMAEDTVYQFLDRKRAEGKRYYVHMVAGCNKFLRIYYARVKEYLDSLEIAA
ncbi:MAG: family transposase [Eubacterium sp.]|nr:family transposase [Eubacterium sp.]